MMSGSPERVPGELFRALAALVLRGDRNVSQGALARELSQRLAPSGIRYHLGTLRRQLSGTVSTIPPEVEAAIRQILRERDHLTEDEDVERRLSASGVAIPPGARSSCYVLVGRILPLAQLWLHLNPGKSKRFLASRLRSDLLREGERSTIDWLQSVLAGKQRLVRRTVHRLLLGYLAERGVTSEEDAAMRTRTLHEEISCSLKRRSFVDAARSRELCRLWQVRRHEPSTRRLAVLLRAKLLGWGLPASVNHLQEIINGDSRRVRYAFLEAMEKVLREEIREGRSVGRALWESTPPERIDADLKWVPARPTTALARVWLAAHPGVSQRELARRLAETLARMGYCSSPSTIQPILGGRRKKTRGFIHRALLAQVHLRAVRSPSSRTRARGLPTPARNGASSDENPQPTWRAFLRRGREYLPSARSPHLVALLAVRAERLYGIPRAEAEAQILGQKQLRRRHASDPPRISDGPSLDWDLGDGTSNGS